MATTGSLRGVNQRVSASDQSSLEQYEDGAAPEQAAYGGQDYADAGAGQSVDSPAGQQQPTAEHTPGELTEAQAMVMANGNEGVARKIMAMDESLKDLSQESGETGNSHLAAALGDSAKDTMASVPAAAAATIAGGPVAGAAVLSGAAAMGAVKGVAGEGIAKTTMNLPKHNGSWRAAAKDTWTNTDIGQRITDFRNRSAYSAQAGDSDGFAGDKYNQ